MTIKDLRRNYEQAGINFSWLSPDPIHQFQTWFDELRACDKPEWFEMNAMTLATSTALGVVSSRIVLLKSVGSDGFTFFTNYDSSKGQQLQENPNAALNFYWPMLERQVRVRGVVQRVDSQISDAYFRDRPYRSRLAAIVSPQSQVIPFDRRLDNEADQLAERYPDEQVPRPDFWGGYRLKPLEVEFWQGRPSRLHDRYIYRWYDGQWSIDRLAP